MPTQTTASESLPAAAPLVPAGKNEEQRWSVPEKTLRQRLNYRLKTIGWRVLVHGPVLLKRFLDVAASAVFLIFLFPVFAATALAIKMNDGGPILFWQTRVGQYGRLIRFPKFRSMVINAEELRAGLIAQNHHKSGVTFKLRHDPRTTKIGPFLRKFSIDELPQLWCVLKGDLSLVGPRPAVPSEVAAYSVLDRRRLEVKPGLTCLWQVSGRGDLAFHRQVELDVEYVNRHSFWFDLVLLWRTIPAVLSGKGSY